ncbi:hypothetical protein [Pontibacter actiniarum]|uniref:Uncharacterized protein n=1 Tax=Pontibacter actiniarum TaxID=323450 RepID=A0A1X9YQS0_9BACT|nr:hypothetical protein [Pontibacter actiniarum]ARS35217.1 hypothetical protein CA264_07055 [Pontibacter actiniarum]
MMKFLRQIFGLNGVTGNRTVVGSPESTGARDSPYLEDSKRRLTELQELCARYKGTPYASEIKAAYDKTYRIHTYLVGRGRTHELEMFHLQHTDNFLNTFTVIINMHRQQYGQKAAATPPEPLAQRTEVVGRTLVLGPFRRDRKEVKAARMQNRETSQRVFVETTEAKTDVPRLSIPEISINTYSKLVYLREDLSDGLTTDEIGFTSTPEEKHVFVNYISGRLGLHGITYVGNAMVYIPDHASSQPAEMVPVIHWNGSPYILSLEDYRLFPVRTYRKSR